MSDPIVWKRIHLVPDTSYAIDKREWPEGPPDYRFRAIGVGLSTVCNFGWQSIPPKLGLEIERLVTENSKLQAELQAFVHEWSERFGFLATENPPDSIESNEEVAQILSRRYPVWNKISK